MSKSGETAMKHARVWAATRFPGPCPIGPKSQGLTCAPYLEAGARLKRWPDKKNPGQFVTQTVREDLFGVFDLAVFPLPEPWTMRDGQKLSRIIPAVRLVQVTTATTRDLGGSSAVRTRKDKVARWVEQTFEPDGKPGWLGEITLLAWVPRRHFLRWDWSWDRQDAHRPWGWVERSPER